MMQRMTLVSLLKQAGDAVSEEQMKALNDALQKIPKNQAQERAGYEHDKSDTADYAWNCDKE